MTISNHIKRQYFADEAQRLIRLAPSQPPPLKPTKRKGTPWTDEEHNRFLEALERFPAGPWKRIAEHVHTRTTRQTMTHAQRYREKIARRRRILRDAGLSAAHLSDDTIVSAAAAATSSATSATSVAAAAAIATTATGTTATGTTAATLEASTLASITAAAIGANREARASTSRSRSTRRSHSGSLARSSISSSSSSSGGGGSSGGANSHVDLDLDAIGGGDDNDVSDGSDSDDGDGHGASRYSDAFDAIEIEFEDIEDEQLLLSLVETYESMPFSEGDARWLVEHYSTISLQASP